MGARHGRAVCGGPRCSGSGGGLGKMACRWKRVRAGPRRKRGPAGGLSAGPGPRGRREHVVKHLERVKNVNWQRFSVVTFLLCGDSAGPMERVRSALRVRGFDPSRSAALTQRAK
ncbi:uncharacterized protein FN964_012960 isoform 2-T2 [Alca torda]